MSFLKRDRLLRGIGSASLGLFLFAASTAMGQEATFEHLVRPKFTSGLQLDGISADGSRVVATYTKAPEIVSRSLVWDASGTPQFLDLLPEAEWGASTYLTSFRQVISADGSLIGGYCPIPDGSPAVSWDENGEVRRLPSPTVGLGMSTSGHVSAVSPNGAYMYGWCQVPPSGGMRPFRWNAAGQETMLQTLSGADAGVSMPISATSTDGTIAVGADYVTLGDGGNDYRPVRWRADGSIEALPLMGTNADGHALGQADLCSGDGSIVVGWLQRYSRTGAYIKIANVCWLPDGRVVELPGAHLAMTPSGNTIVGDARFDLVNGQIVRTELVEGNEFGVIYAQDVSDDGRIMAGGGSPRSTFPGAQVWIHNRRHSLEDLLADRGVELPEGWESLDWIYFCSADGKVFVGEGKFGGERTAFRVTIPDIFVDREAPEFVETLAPIRRFCDAGKTFATVTLPTPKATDNFPGKVVVTTTAGPRFPIGTTNVVWTAKDAKGNVARRGQKVIVTNRAPKANAGPDRTITTASERGVRVVLDGSKSSDPDKQALKYAWTTKKVKFANGTTAKPSGPFPVGTTVVTLTVTDAGGLKHKDTVRVTVKLKNAKRRPRGSQANESFAAAARSAGAAVSGNATAASGFASASIASAYGDAAGEFVRWEEGQSPTDAEFSYAELRSLQQAYGAAAAQSLFSAYAETGDESLLSAYRQAAYGAAFAGADLTDN